MNLDTKIKIKRYYSLFSPILWLSIGFLVFMISTNNGHDWMRNLEFQLMEDNTYKTSDGRFACWWIDEAMQKQSFQNESDFVKELFQLHKKYCEDMPRL